jgi:hypothetical protein
LIALVERLRRGAEDDDELQRMWAEFATSFPHPFASDVLAYAGPRTPAADIVDLALSLEAVEIEGLPVPVRVIEEGRWLWFVHPQQTALRFARTFRELIEHRESGSNQGFSVYRPDDPDELAEAQRRWRTWTGRDLGDDVMALAPAWGHPGEADERVIAPRTFLLALAALEERFIHDRS